MSRRFNKLGLRRDLNFSDLDNPQQSLNNLLNNLVTIPGETFDFRDLDVIRDIKTSQILNSDFRNIAGAALKVNDPVTGRLEVYTPVVTLKNRLDVSKFSIGDPNFYGGDGLTTRYYESDQITSDAEDVNNIFTGPPVETTIAWERGIFDFLGKIQSSLTSVYGGVEWNGWFRPTTNGVWTLNVSTTGFSTVEFDDGTSTIDPVLALRHRKSEYEYDFQVAAAAQGATALTLTTPANAVNLFAADVLINTSIPQFDDPESVGYTGTPVTITGVNLDNGVLTLSSPLAEAISSPTNFIFRHNVGLADGSVNITLGNLEAYRPYRIKLKFWIPNSPFVITNPDKKIVYTISPPDSSSTRLNYKWLYSEGYDVNPTLGTDQYGDFRTFYTSRLTEAGGLVGGSSSYDDYQRIVSKSPLSVTYNPPTSLAAITKRTIPVGTTIDTNIISVNNTDGIEVGNYVFSNGALQEIPQGTRVTGVSINSGLFLSANATLTFPLSLAISTSTSTSFIDHRGLIAWGTLVSYVTNGHIVSNLTPDITSQISIGDLLVSPDTQPLTTVVAKTANTVTLNKPFTGSASGAARVYFYRSKGVVNNGLSAFCTGVVAAPTMVQSSKGSTSLTVGYTDGIVLGMKVQFGSQILLGTTVTEINGKTISISTPLDDDIPVDQLITFAPANTPDDVSKEVCFPPTDTSPPFIATDDGLSTSSGRPNIGIFPDFAEKGVLKFVGLQANNVTVEPTTVSPSYNRTVLIKDITGTTFYQILASD